LNLTVCADNEVARKLYEKMGFSETGDVYDDEIVYRFVF
jgi:diamine N-acetyltransferase